MTEAAAAISGCTILLIPGRYSKITMQSAAGKTFLHVLRRCSSCPGYTMLTYQVKETFPWMEQDVLT